MACPVLGRMLSNSRVILLLKFSAVAAMSAAFAGCSGAPDGSRVGTSTASAITQATAVSRGMEWVTAKLQYCESAYDQRDYDTSCSSICTREENPAWDAYRSDCSGFVTWAWGLPPVGDGGYVTSDFAPYDTSFSSVIEASSLEPGDAANRNSGGHIVLFERWVTPGSEAVFMEEPGCSSSTPYAHEFTSGVSVSGSNIYIDFEGESFTAIRFDSIVTGADGGGASPPPPPPPPPPGADCYSDTLGRDMPENSCVQSASNSEWYQCDDGSWVDRWDDPAACIAVYPL
jgi:hypothetical protein